MPSNNSFAKLTLDRSRILEAVESLGAENIQYQQVGGTKQLSCTLKGAPFKMAVYENKDGTTTMTCLNGQDRNQFDEVAQAIKTHCSLGDVVPFNVSLHKVPAEHADHLVNFLKTEATVDKEEESSHYKLIKLRGTQGDVLTVKTYTNGTVQLQGRRAMLAVLAQNFLVDVLPYKDAVQLQIDTFAVPIKVDQIVSELAAKLPLSHASLGNTIRAQLASALALTKVDIALPDYGAIAFPALRGLEGFIKASLTDKGFCVPKRDAFHEYFEAKAPGFAMRPDAASMMGEPSATRIANCYTLYNRQRHSIAHMDADPEMSRMLASADEARTIVSQVFDILENFHK